MGMLRVYLETFGRRGLIVALLSRLSKYINRPLVISIPINQPGLVYKRLRTDDIAVYKEVFVDSRLSFELLKPPHVIIDAGAYTGLSSVYFATRYPDAKVIAIEPEKRNFDLLLRNTRAFTNIFPIQAALWTEQTELSVFDPGRGQSGFQALESESDGIRIQRVPTVTIEQLMHEHRLGFIDILKLDIEGAEREVFECSGKWISKVGVLVVELHDRLRAGCTAAFENATSDFEYEEKRRGRTIRMRKDFALLRESDPQDRAQQGVEH